MKKKVILRRRSVRIAALYFVADQPLKEDKRIVNLSSIESPRMRAAISLGATRPQFRRGKLPTDNAKNGATHRDGARDLASAVFARLPPFDVLPLRANLIWPPDGLERLAQEKTVAAPRQEHRLVPDSGLGPLVKFAATLKAGRVIVEGRISPRRTR